MGGFQDDAAWLEAWDDSILGCSRGVGPVKGSAGRSAVPVGATELAVGVAADIAFPLLGALLAGWLTARVGRRAAVFVGVLLMATGQVRAAAAPRSGLGAASPPLLTAPGPWSPLARVARPPPAEPSHPRPP